MFQELFNNLFETKRKFIQNPEHNDYSDIMYLSGDLVKIDKKIDKFILFQEKIDKLNIWAIELN